MIRLFLLIFAAFIITGCQPKPFNATVVSAGKQSAIAGEWLPRSTGTDTDFGTMTITKDALSFALGGEANLSMIGNVAALEWRSTSKALIDMCGSKPPNLASFTLTDKDQLLSADTPGQWLEVRFFREEAGLAIYPPSPNERLCRISTWER
ncbi:MAG: hypothetical protein ABJP70_07095 [Erythrobacter sp.]